MNIKPVASIRKIKPYVPPLDGRRGYDGLLLDFNEKVGQNPANLYPEYEALRQAVAGYCTIDRNQIVLTAGAGAGISLVFRAYCEVNDEVIIPKPSFELLFQAARIAGAKITMPSYDEATAAFPVSAVWGFTKKPKIIVICNPNNPTGTLLDLITLQKIATKYTNTIILVDEAYFEYGNVTAVGLIKTCPNIVVLRTFSKAFGMAALRVGYIVACPPIIATLLSISNPYDIAMPSSVAAARALKDVKSMKAYTQEVMKVSKQYIEDFFMEYGLPFYPSDANFVCFKTLNITDTLNRLVAKKVLIRKVDNASKLRVTVGTLASAKLFVKALREILEETALEKVACIDRDGTMIFEPQNTFQVDELDQLKVLPGVVMGLKALLANGFRLVMVTNQNGIGTASFPKAKFLNVQNAFLMQLAQEDIYFDRVCVCPHFPADKCACRKPQTTLVDELFKKYSIDTTKSIMIGDRETDVQFAQNVRIPSIRMATNAAFPAISFTKKGEIVL